MKVIALLTFENSIILAYTLIGFMSLIAYLPQIFSLYKTKGPSLDISMQTWLVWCLDALVSLSYVAIILRDPIASFFMAIDFMGSLCILGLTLSNRIRTGVFGMHSMRISAFARMFER